MLEDAVGQEADIGRLELLGVIGADWSHSGLSHQDDEGEHVGDVDGYLALNPGQDTTSPLLNKSVVPQATGLHEIQHFLGVVTITANIHLSFVHFDAKVRHPE